MNNEAVQMSKSVGLPSQSLSRVHVLLSLSEIFNCHLFAAVVKLRMRLGYLWTTDQDQSTLQIKTSCKVQSGKKLTVLMFAYLRNFVDGFHSLVNNLLCILLLLFSCSRGAQIPCARALIDGS